MPSMPVARQTLHADAPRKWGKALQESARWLRASGENQMYSPRFTALFILLAASGLSFGCAGQTDGSDSDASKEDEELVIRGGFNPRPPTVIGVAPDPTFPQKNLYVIGRTVTPRVLATSTTPAVPGAATFTLGWESTGSPTQVFVFRQVMILG